MDWFKFVNTTGEKVIVNANLIACVTYHKETNLTEIVLSRAAYPPLFMRGDTTKDIDRLLCCHDSFVSRIGEL